MNAADALPELEAAEARRLMARLEDVPLYAHAYAFHLNFRAGRLDVEGLLDFAHRHRLRGIKVHLDDGEADGLRHAEAARLTRVRDLAHDQGLDLHLEVSETAFAELAQAVRIGRALEATSIRCYPRYAGRVSDIIDWTIRDLRRLPELDPEGRFRFTVEQHEDLKGDELVRIVEAVGHPRLGLLFDFCNMLNAHERPLDALAAMAPHVTDVHIKDARIVEDRGGWGQQACRSGEGDMPQARLLLELLRLGETSPRVVAFGLEEEAGFYAPPLRFPDEGEDPVIPPRAVSMTEMPGDADPEALLARERRDALDQLNTVRDLLAQLRRHVARYL